jgi:dipeptidyl aminopeptidase/acylaminoacyl peptidase
MKAIKNKYKVFFTRISCFIFWLVTCPFIMGQAYPKKQLAPSDYKLWSFLIPDQISDNGNWTSYRLHYKYTDNDTLFLQHSSDNTKGNALPRATKGKFNGELTFGCIAGDTFNLVNLKNKNTFKRNGAYHFEFSADHKYVMLILKQADGKFGIEIRNNIGKVIFETSNVNRYRFDPKLNGIAYSISKPNSFKMQLVLLSDINAKHEIIENTSSSYQNIIWKGDKIAFIQNVKDAPILYSYDLKRKKLKLLNSSGIARNSIQKVISNQDNLNPILSADGSQIFFWLKEVQDEDSRIKEDEVQVWNAKDKLLFDFYKQAPYYVWSDKLAVWNMKSNTVRQITDKKFSKAFLSPQYDTAFIFDPASYEPQSMQMSPYDLYAFDLKTGNKNLIFKNHYPGKSLSVSPDGLYLSYAKEGHWWIYNIKKKNNTCITSTASSIFYNEENDVPNNITYYGMGAWTRNGQIIIYDRYDLWLISVDGKTKMRLTNGRESQKTFRLKLFDTESVIGDTEFIKNTVNLNQSFLMTVENKETGESGLSSWNFNSGVKELVWTAKKISLVSKAKNKNAYMYLDQNFTCPPRLMLCDSVNREIVQTNKQQQLYMWGRNERIEYMSDGVKAKGILFYPANYQKGNKYPMVVYLYERLFSKLNEYQNPSLISPDGFNATSFTLQDYFVLYPDVIYEVGNLKYSVTKSVLAAVDTVIQKGDVKPDKIGLIGHSFGGYEVDLIITQTHRFAAAVAGAAVTDLISAYLYDGPLFRRPDYFRTENHQFRIGSSLYDDMPAFLNNSPVLLAGNVQTPLLAWAGEEDRQVHTFQSMEFYLALRRLNKIHTLLIYPGEDHQINNKKNAIDLSLRISKWFGHYLKDEPEEGWMKCNFNR